MKSKLDQLMEFGAPGDYLTPAQLAKQYKVREAAILRWIRRDLFFPTRKDFDGYKVAKIHSFRKPLHDFILEVEREAESKQK